MSEIYRDADRVALWLGGGVYLGDDDTGVVLDAPEGCAAILEAADRLDRVDAIVLSGGRASSVAGLFGLLAALTEARSGARPVRVWSPVGEDRPGRLIEAAEGWEPHFPIVVEGEPPGAVIEAGPFALETVPLRRGELRQEPLRVVEQVAVGFRCRGPLDVAWVPGGGASVARRLCRGARLAVVEVGVRRWPAHPGHLRLTVEEAIRSAGTAEQIVLVGDDGRLLDVTPEA